MRSALLVLAIIGLPLTALAQGAQIGWLKTVSGTVTVQRAGTATPAAIGMPLQKGDIIETGDDGSAGVTLADNSTFSAGPRSKVSVDEFDYDSSTLKGNSLTNLQRGTLSASSGDIARGTPGAMRVRTPSAVLAVRGTTFLVRVEE